LLAWGGMPVYRWLTTPKPRSSLSITKPSTQQGTVDPREPFIGYPSEARWKEIIAEAVPDEPLPNSPAPTPNPSKP
jgi:hypothetical protein